MLKTVKFLIFLIYITMIFMIQNYYLLLGILFINILFTVLLKIKPLRVLRSLFNFSFIILIALIFNTIFVNIQTALVISAKLLLVAHATYVFSKIFAYNDLAYVIQTLAYPLKIFKIKPKDIGLFVTIGIAFIPILKNELEQIRYVLTVKGFNMRFTNLSKNLSLIFKPFFVSLFQRINEIEFSLKSKGYQE